MPEIVFEIAKWDFFCCHFCLLIYLFKWPGSSKVVLSSAAEDEEGLLLNACLCIYGKKEKKKTNFVRFAYTDHLAGDEQ